MRYPQTFIDDLRRQADIVRIVQDYVSLKKAGQNWVARCPFHKETKPSFSVNPAKEIFYCFGCQKGGSVFNFIMEIERVTFPEAIKIVADPFWRADIGKTAGLVRAARDYLVRIADPAALVVISVELGLCIVQEYVLFLR